MLTAKCNVCGKEWEVVDKHGVNMKDRLKVTGWFNENEDGIPMNSCNASLCSLECVIVWARMEQKDIAECEKQKARSEGWHAGRQAGDA